MRSDALCCGRAPCSSAPALQSDSLRAFYLSSWLSSFLFGVEPRDGVVFVTVPVALTLIGLATVAVVARRAARVDPLDALRHE